MKVQALDDFSLLIDRSGSVFSSDLSCDFWVTQTHYARRGDRDRRGDASTASSSRVASLTSQLTRGHPTRPGHRRDRPPAGATARTTFELVPILFGSAAAVSRVSTHDCASRAPPCRTAYIVPYSVFLFATVHAKHIEHPDERAPKPTQTPLCRGCRWHHECLRR